MKIVACSLKKVVWLKFYNKKGGFAGDVGITPEL
jgi:hypothetical protein